MGILTGILVAIGAIILVALIKISTTFFHEMGHAIPALLFTTQPVKVYIGSYGDISKTTQFTFGRLQIYFKWNLLDWKMGMCSHEGNVKTTMQRVLIILGGPIASLFISIPLMLNLGNLQHQQLPFFISIVFIAAALYDFVINMIPMDKPIPMHDGSVMYCDGYALFNLMQRSAAPPEFFELEQKMHDKKYAEVIELAQSNIEENPNNRFSYEFMIEAFIQQKEYDSAIKMYNILKLNISLTDDDYFGIGKVYSKNGNYEEALKFFDHYKYKHFKNPHLLREIAIANLELGNNEKVIETTTALMHVDQTFLPAYVLRSHALINMREYDHAKADLDAVFGATDQDPRGNFVYGLFYEKLDENKKALTYYKKARALGFEHHGLIYKIERIEGELGV